MNTPILLMGAALLFWGFQVGLLFPAIIMAIALEGSRWIKIRWEFSDRDYTRIMDLCVYLSVAVMAYAVLTDMKSTEVMGLFAWMPMLVLPIMLAQVYGDKDTISFGALSLVARKKHKKKQEELPEDSKKNRLNISFIYLSVCLLSSGIGNNRELWLYGILFFLVAWALWSGRNPAYPSWFTVILLLIIGYGGFLAQIGMQELHTLVEEKMMDLMIGNRGSQDPFQTRTAIGSIGELKLSDEIIYRINTERNSQPPSYLRNSNYNIYGFTSETSTWYSSPRSFDLIKPHTNKTSWQIHEPIQKTQESKIVVSTRLDSDENILPVPLGITSLADLRAESVGLSRLGAIQLTGAMGWIHAKIDATSTAAYDLQVTEKDLLVPERLQSMLHKVMENNDLIRATPEKTIQAINGFFRKQFSYSLVQKEREKGVNSLEHFLTKTKAGHCEFFATSSVLLARMAGIPARYATGWAVSEFSELEQCYLVRARHAHSWSMLFVDGKWQLLDTTPSNWLAEESESSSMLRPIKDFYAWCMYRFYVWRDLGNHQIPPIVYWIAIPVIFVATYRFIIKRTKQSELPTEDECEDKDEQRGMDSDFLKIEKCLVESGYERYASETFISWMDRLELINDREFYVNDMRDILRLYYSYRFNPECKREDCKQQLNILVNRWLSNFSASSNYTDK